MPFPRRALVTAVRVLLGGGAALLGPVAPAHAQLPITCAAGTCGAGGPSAWVSSGVATRQVIGNTLDVHQTSESVILNWAQFNVGPGNAVRFRQPDAAAFALNRIYQGDASRILGALSANGQVYLINQNGIVFGPNARVDVNTLVASTLRMSDLAVQQGILTPAKQGLPAFSGTGGAVTVERGALLRAASGGRIMILAPRITNRGTIETPNGQTLLAAGNKVYLTASSDPNLRGLLVEVDVDAVSDPDLRRFLKGGTSTLSAGALANLGRIVAQRGNVTLMGLAVNQGGMVSATTAVDANGSIELLARDRVDARNRGGTFTFHATRTGAVTFGPGSVTRVDPESANPQTAVDDQTQRPSIVAVVGHTIHLEPGSTITARSGRVTLDALENPDARANAARALPIPRNDSRIQIDAGSRIDVSGLDVMLPAGRNLVQVELRGTELRDSPLQRNGVLRGKTVTVDIRKGTPLADISGALANIRRTVAERSTRGGTVTLDSEGDVVLQPGSGVDVSGGAVHYRAGFLHTSQLLSRGKVYDISRADPNRVYDGVLRTFTQTFRRWGITRTFDILSGRRVAGTFSPAYTQGADAGTLAVLGRGLQLAGDLRGARRVGPFQRAGARLPRSGGLVIGDPTGGEANGLPKPDFRAPNVVFSDVPATATFGLRDALAPDLALSLSARRLFAGGIGRLAVYSNGRVRVPAGTNLTLPAGGSLTLSGRRVELGDRGAGADAPVLVSAPGGTVTLTGVTSFRRGDGTRPGVFLGDGTRLFAGGRWINDNPLVAGSNPLDPAPIDGGAVTVSVHAAGGSLTIGGGVHIDVSGGAWRTAAGALRAGRGGAVTLDVDAQNVGVDIGRGMRLDGFGVGSAAGGTLAVRAPQVRVAGADPDGLPAQRAGSQADGPGPAPLRLAGSLFAAGGFHTYTVTATGGLLHPAGGGTLPPLMVVGDVRVRAARREPAGDVEGVPTGTPMSAVGRVRLLPEGLRTPSDLSLRVAPSRAQSVAPDAFGDLVIAAGARIETDPGAAVSLYTDAPRGIVVDGRIDVPAGTIRLHIDNPPAGGGVTDLGFVPGQAIRLGPQAVLADRGAVRLTPNALGLRLGEILPGGTVELRADRGAIVTAPGSRIDVSGTAATLDLAPTARAAGAPTRARFASAAGSIILRAPEGMVLAGALVGRAGDGPGAAGGSLTLAVTRKAGFLPPAFPPNPFPATPRTIVLGGAAGVDAFAGVLAFDPARAAAGGFDRLSLTADDAIRFARGRDLHLRGSLVLRAPALVAAPGVARVALGAAYVALGPQNPATQGAPAPTGGAAVLDVDAGLIDLIGHTALQGLHAVRLVSRGDIRLRGVASAGGGSLDGALGAVGDLTLQAARVYPTTFSRFTIRVPDGSGGSVRIAGGGVTASPLSAGGELRIRAPRIVQAGVLQAPFGTLDLEASGALVLEAGSVTSTSAQGRLVPFGQTRNSGQQWVYDVGYGVDQAPVITAPPAQHVRLAGADVEVRSGARVDLSGGGDLYAYEFVPGPGGSKDALAPANAPDTYAILPGLVSPWAPFDEQAYLGSTLRPDDGVYLAGGGALAAGRYALLPARYALLPGAFLVKTAAGFRDLQPGQRAVLADGTPVVAGERIVAGTDLRADRWSGFAIRPGSYARRLAEYQDHFAGAFFARAARKAGTPPPRLPADAGRLAVVARSALTLQGTLGSAAAAGARGAQVDIVAPRLEVVSGPGGGAADGTVRLSAARLTALGAESLLLGASRSPVADGVRVEVGTDRLTIADGVNLAAPELILAARDTLSVGAGARLRGTGTFSGAPQTLILGRGGDGDGALLRLSSGPQAAIVRAHRRGVRGTLEVGADAVLAADRSMILDATRDARSGGRIELPAGGALRLSASRIRLGEVSGTGGGLALSNADLTRFDALGELVLSSQGTIDLYGAVRLGDDVPGGVRPGTLLLEGAGLAAGAPPAPGTEARLSADTIRFANPDGVAAGAAPAVAAGTLSLQADRIRLDAGSYAIAGYSKVRLHAQSVVGAGSARLSVGGDLDLAASLTGAAGADLTVDASGHSVRLLPAAGTAAVPAGLGARIAILARDLVAAGRIDLPSGTLRLVTRGDLTLASGADLRLAGIDRPLGDTAVSTPGGRLRLDSATGAVRFAAGSRVDVSGAPGGADAGRVTVSAPAGTVDVQGTLSGTAADGYRQGSFRVYAGGLTDLASLDDRLNRGGLTEGRSIRTAHGDLIIGAADTVRARNLYLSADGGSISVQGILDASGSAGARVQLDARDDVTVVTGARIDARALGAGAHGGRVVLATTRGVIDVQAGSRIDVSGAGGGGRVDLRAPQVETTPGAGFDEAGVRALAGTIVGADAVRLEAFRSYDGATLAPAQWTAWRSDAQAFSAFFPAIAARLGQDVNPAFRIVPGIEVDGAADLTLAADWDLFPWRFAGAPGVLTLRAQGNLDLNASLSDGFVGTRPGAVFRDGASWSYRLVAGADPLAADPLAVRPMAALAPDQGSVRLAAGRLVRTGTGGIEVAAARDVTLGDARSVIYTAGAPAVPSVSGGGFFSRGVTRNWPTGGGDLVIRAGRDVRGVAGDQLVTAWLRRRGGASLFGRPVSTEWALAFSEFQQGVGALGGGDVTITAGRDVDNLSASIPTTGRRGGTGGIRTRGGGDLAVDAGRDIRSGLFFVGRGYGRLRAGGSVISGRVANGHPVHTLLALGAGRIDLTARGDLQLETVFNPTVSGQPNGTGFSDLSVFFTYAPDSAVRLLSLSGDLALMNDSTTIEQAARSVRFNPTAALFVYPPSVRASAPEGSIDLSSNFWLFPAARGGLDLLAGHDVRAEGAVVGVSDGDPGLLPSPARPSANYTNANVEITFDHAAKLLHAADPVPIRVIAAAGDLLGGNWRFAKAARLIAGRDIVDLNVQGQNINSGDVTIVQAGRDLRYGASVTREIRLGGPGRLAVTAGRDVDLGFSAGITTVGNALNGALPARGAGVTVLVGAATPPAYAGFIRRYFAPGARYSGLLTEAMRRRSGLAALTPGEALARFRALPAIERRPLILRAFYRELRDTGRAATADGSGFQRGFDAIHTLFPGSGYRGDLNMFFSRIYTLSGGDINLLVPGGLVNAGLANPPPNLGESKRPSDLGIVAQGPGSVRAFTRGDFLVNQSRVFTLQGGDILIWSSRGNIDAGRGAKTAISAPPPRIIVDANGNVRVDFSNAVAGSGIRAIVTREGITPGNVDLIAPTGVVNAGDAGIGSAGNLNIAAVSVLGTQNIQVGGVSTGVPAANTVSLAAGLTGVSNLAGSVSQIAQQSLNTLSRRGGNAPGGPGALSFLTVQFLGFGD